MSKKSVAAVCIVHLISALSSLSLRSSQRLGSAVGRLLWWIRFLHGSPGWVTMTNLRHCFPELTDSERCQFALSSLQHTGMMYCELGIAWQWPVAQVRRLIREVEGEDLLRQALEAAEGVILLAPHLGNWELARHYFEPQTRVAILYQRPKIEALDTYIREVRQRINTELMPASNRGVLQLIRYLSEGRTIGVLPDQDQNFVSGEFAPFFGLPANTIKLVSKLLQRHPARVLCVCAERLPNAEGFRILIHQADEAIYSPDLQTSVAALNRTVEALVRRCPEQYQWEYKRFKYRPGGARNFY